ncbi:MAG: DNA primase [Microgenomates group bacterium]
MDNPVEEIKKRIDIVEFIGSFIQLKKTGRNFKALCPFHQEKTPSFIVSPERQIWHCFGACNEGGDVIKFLMKWENITFFEALKDLAKRVGIQLKKIDFEDKIWRKKERYIYMNQLAADFFQYLLFKTTFGQKAIDYLSSRKIKKEIIEKFHLGYATNSWDSLLRFLKRKKFEEEEMFENGLLVKNERGNFYDRFRGRLIFPIKDARGNILGFSGRTLLKDEKEAKYINTPETPIYHKRETLFGLDLAKDEIKKEKHVYIVEGEFDVISPFQAGFKNFVAVKGTALTREQLMILKRYTNIIVLALDSDFAGQESMVRSLEEAEKLDFEIKTVTFDYAKDPDEAVNQDLIKFKKIVKKPIPIYDFLISFYQKKYPEDDPFNKKKFTDEIIPFISRIYNPIVQSHYIKKISQLLEVSEASIEKLIKRTSLIKKTAFFTSFNLKKEKIKREILIEKYLLSLFFQSDQLDIWAEKIFKVLSPGDFLTPSYQKIVSLFLDYKNKNVNFTLDDFIKQIPLVLKPVFDEVFLFASVDQRYSLEDIEKLILEVKKYSLKRKIKKLLSNEENKEDEKQKNMLKQLFTELNSIEKRLIKL